MVLKLYVLLGNHIQRTHTKFCDKICHILRVMGKMSVPDIKNLDLASHKKETYIVLYLKMP